MKLHSLGDLFVDGLRDLYSAENQIIKALPKMAKASSSPELRQGFEEHLEQTRGHVQRLEQIFAEMNVSPRGKKCVAMKGLIAEGKELMDQDLEGAVMDAGLIEAAQKVEHYEVAGYGCARTWAEHLGHHQAAELLQQTLNEEKSTDQKLTQIAEQMVNAEAQAQEPEMAGAGAGGGRERGRNGRHKK
jgi:ferritin-like metal-binding protein YciE